jgi:hypothetical protein
MDSSTKLEPCSTSPSVGMRSPGNTFSTSPRCTRSSDITLVLSLSLLVDFVEAGPSEPVLLELWEGLEGVPWWECSGLAVEPFACLPELFASASSAACKPSRPASTRTA